MYKSMEEIIQKATDVHMEFWEVILEDDCKERGITKEESFAQMKEMYLAMKQADEAYDKKLVSASGLCGKDGDKMRQAKEKQTLLCGDFIGTVMEKALKMGESNACMKRIVAAPTAGSCGVLPAVLLTLQETKQYTQEEMVKALYVSAGIGGVIASRAFLAGAAGGCQAEIGSASAMAAGAITYLQKGSLKQISDASAIALKGLLGLACDPVAGLVEVPCVKRNVIGAVNALTSSDMARAGIESKIPADEVFDAMRTIGKSLPSTIKETGEGGLAITPTGLEYKEKLEQDML